MALRYPTPDIMEVHVKRPDGSTVIVTIPADFYIEPPKDCEVVMINFLG
jgi:hypothetical protein